MIEKYIDVLFKAIEMRDMELIMLVLSKDTSVDKFRKLKSIRNYQEGNVYEHLLLNKENDILRLFIDAGLLQIINEPINDKGELLIDLAYRYKNLPLILSLLSEREVDLNVKTHGISFLDKVTTTYAFENTILENLKVCRPELPVEDYKAKKLDCELLSKIVVDESCFPNEANNQESFLNKIIPKEKQGIIKDGFANISQTIKAKISEIQSTQQSKKEDGILLKKNLLSDNKESDVVYKEPIEGQIMQKTPTDSDKKSDEIEEVIIIDTDKNRKE